MRCLFFRQFNKPVRLRPFRETTCNMDARLAPSRKSDFPVQRYAQTFLESGRDLRLRTNSLRSFLCPCRSGAGTLQSQIQRSKFVTDFSLFCLRRDVNLICSLVQSSWGAGRFAKIGMGPSKSRQRRPKLRPRLGDTSCLTDASS
jgi:hypothetical protein